MQEETWVAIALVAFGALVVVAILIIIASMDP